MKVTESVVPPPGVGLVTVMLAVPGERMFVVGTIAVNSVLDTYVVVKDVPFQFIVESDTKFVPVAVRVNCGLFMVMVVGEMEVKVGVGFNVVKVRSLP